MNKRGQMSLGMIVLLVVGVVVVLALMPTIINEQYKMTNKLSVDDETTNLTTEGCYTAGGQVNESDSDCNITVDAWYPSGDWRLSEGSCDLSSVTVTNGTGTELTASTDYNLHADEGLVEMLNTSDTESTNILVDYDYCDEGYNKDSGSRGMASVISLFAALALLAFVMVPVVQKFL